LKEEATHIDTFTLIYSLPGSYEFYAHEPTTPGEVFEICDFEGNLYSFIGTSRELDIDNLSNLELHFNSEKPSTTLEEYTDMFLQAYSKLNSGDLEKIILSKIKTVDFETKHLLDYLTYLKAFNQNAFVYLVSCPELGTWLGATPEKLVEGSGKLFRTMALAGTKAYVKDQKPAWAEKELEEHEIVASEIESILSEIKADFTKQERTNHKSGQVVHLKTDFEFECEDIQSFISKLHPSPAISGKPKEKSIRAIKEIEIHNRSLQE
jgi:isochorismate synthase